LSDTTLTNARPAFLSQVPTLFWPAPPATKVRPAVVALDSRLRRVVLLARFPGATRLAVVL
jgi:hypothetical protein